MNLALQGKVVKVMNRKLSWMVLAMLLLVSIVAACQSVAPTSTANPAAVVGKEVKSSEGSYKNISVAELQMMIKTKDFVLVNVHIPFEGNLPKTDLSIPYDGISQNLSKLPGDKNSKIVLYCRSGHMSTIAATELVKLGYTNLWNLEGGMAAWEQAGQPIEK
jgi:rhodanese-related sulfurtransferase